MFAIREDFTSASKLFHIHCITYIVIIKRYTKDHNALHENIEHGSTHDTMNTEKAYT